MPNDTCRSSVLWFADDFDNELSWQFHGRPQRLDTQSRNVKVSGRQQVFRLRNVPFRKQATLLVVTDVELVILYLSCLNYYGLLKPLFFTLY